MTITIVTARPLRPRPMRTTRPGFRSCVLATLALIVVSIVASAPTASANPVLNKKCVEISEDYDLRNAARDSNVFLVAYESSEKEGKESICKKLEATPAKRMSEAADKGKGAVIAVMEIKEGSEDYEGNWIDGNRGFAKGSLGAKSFPAYMFITKGMDRTSKWSNHVTHYKSTPDSIDMADVEKFIEKKIGYRLGNDVYNIVFFDTVASRFISYGDAEGMDYYKQRMLALLVRFSTLFSFKEPFASIGKLYNRAFAMSFEHGMDYCEKNVDKLTKKLEKNSKNLSQDKQHEFQQKIAVLKSFSDPKELTPEDDKQIFIHAALHLGLLIATILLFVMPAEDEPEKDGGDGKIKDGKDVIHAEPVDAKVADGDKKTD